MTPEELRAIWDENKKTGVAQQRVRDIAAIPFMSAASSDMTQEHAAAVLEVNKVNGIPTSIARDMPLEELGPYRPDPLDKIRNASASLQSWYTRDPVHAALTKGEEEPVAHADEALTGWRADLARGNAMKDYPNVGYADAQAAFGLRPPLTEEEAALEARLRADLKKYPNQYDWFYEFPQWAASLLVEQGPVQLANLEAAAGGVGKGGLAGMAMGVAAGLPMAATGVGAPAGALTVMGTTAAGATAGAMVEMARSSNRMEGALLWAELKDIPGVDLEAAAALSLLFGAFNGAIEVGAGPQKLLTDAIEEGFGGLIEKGAGKKLSKSTALAILGSPTARAAAVSFARKIFGSAVSEGGEEVVQQIGSIVSKPYLEQTADGGGFDLNEYLKKVFSLDTVGEMAIAGLGGAVGGLGYGSVTATPSLMGDMYQARQAKAKVNQLKALGAKLKESRAAKQYVGDSADDEVYLDAAPMYQYWVSKGAKPEEIAADLGIDAKAFTNAVEEDGTVKVRLGTLAQTFGGTDHWDFFANEMRQEPGAFNAREAEVWEKKVRPMIVEQEQRNAGTLDNLKEQEAQKFIAAGMPEEKAQAAAEITAAMHLRAAVSENADPLEYYKEHGFGVDAYKTVNGVLQQIGAPRQPTGEYVADAYPKGTIGSVEWNDPAWAGSNGLTEGHLDIAISVRKELKSAKQLLDQGLDSGMPGVTAENIDSRIRDADQAIAASADVIKNQDPRFQTGKPVTVRAFHGGSTPDIAVKGFDPTKRGTNTGAPSAKMGDFFAGRPETANNPSYTGKVGQTRGVAMRNGERVRAEDLVGPEEYAKDSVASVMALNALIFADGNRSVAEKKIKDGQQRLEEADLAVPRDKENAEKAVELIRSVSLDGISFKQSAPVVYPARLHFNNPYVHDYKGASYREESYASIIAKAKKAGHDGVILLNTYDGGPLDNIFVAFDDQQIEQTLYQNKPFDSSPNILMQGPRTNWLTLQPKPNLDAVNPLSVHVQREGIAGAQGRLTRAVERAADIGAPDNERTVFNKDGNTFVVGNITAQDWLDRVKQNLTPEEVKAARTWYGDLHNLMSLFFGKENAEKYALAWLLSQQNESPSGGMRNVLRAADMARGLPEIKKAGLAQRKLIETLRGELPKEGYDAKLLDFIDSELRKTTRTVMGDDPRGGQPAVIDVWANRDVGKVDQRTLKYIADTFGEEAASTLQVDGDGIGETDYEYGSKFYNALADELNRGNVDGGGWLPLEAQAVGWTAMQKQLGATPEFPQDIFDKNTVRVSIGLIPGHGSPLSSLGVISKEAAARVVDEAAKATGVRVREVQQGVGSYMGETEPAFQVDVLGSPESLQDFAAIVGHALQQTEVILSRPMKSGKADGITLVDRSNKLSSPEAAEQFMAEVRAALPEGSTIANGYQLVMINGLPALRLFRGVWDEAAGRVNWAGRFPAKEVAAFTEAVNNVSEKNEIGLEFHRDNFVVQSEFNNWRESPEGEAFRDSLLSRGRDVLASRLGNDDLRILPDEVGPPAGIPLGRIGTNSAVPLDAGGTQGLTLQVEGGKPVFYQTPATGGGFQSQTAAFKKWFGDSKVVDGDGKPLRVYTGTTRDITEFAPRQKMGRRNFYAGELGTWFGSKPGIANVFANKEGGVVYPSFLSIQNPKVFEDYSDFQDFVKGRRSASAVRADLEREGFDGILIKDSQTDYAGLRDDWIVFQSNQIKSAIGNAGTFDPNNPNILFQSAFHGSPYRFDRFTLDHIGKGEGAQAFGWGLYFAGKRAIGEYYRKKLSTEKGFEIVFNGEISDVGKSASYEVGFIPWTDGYTVEDLAAELSNIEKDAEAAWLLENADRITVKQKALGQLYEVNIPDDSEMLQWDKPLSEQPEKVREALAKAGLWNESAYQKWLAATDPADKRAYSNDIAQGSAIPPMTPWMKADGADLYDKLSKLNGSDEAASKYLNSLGIPGISYPAESLSGGKGDSRNYVIFDDSAIQILQTYYQGQEGPRGFYIPDTSGGPRQINIGLLQGADVTTALHEIMHGHFDLMRDRVADIAVRAMTGQTIAPAETQVLKDYETLVEWFQGRVKDGGALRDLASYSKTDPNPARRELFARAHQMASADPTLLPRIAAGYVIPGDPAMTQALFTPFHEYQARGFEKYVMEGNAPSVRLQKVFARIKAWMLVIYRAISLDVKLNADVRAVFDRMLASEDEIAEVRKQVKPVFADFKALGWSDEKTAAYRERIARVNEEASTQLAVEQLRQWKRGQEKWWREQTATYLEEARQSLLQQPIYDAMDQMRRKDGAGFKLSRAEVRQMWPDLEAALDKHGILRHNDSLSANEVAELFGFESGDAMVRQMAATTPLQEAASKAAEERMAREYGDLFSDAPARAEAAWDAVLERQGEVLAWELKEIARINREARPAERAVRQEQRAARTQALATLRGVPDRAVFKAIAQGRIGQTTIKDLRPDLYLLAMKKSGRLAAEAMGKGDGILAATHKQAEMLNLELYLAATAAKKQIEKDRAFFRRVFKGGTEAISKSREPGFVQAARAVLAAYGFGPAAGKKAIEYLDLVKEYDPQLYASLETTLNALTDPARVKPYNQMQYAFARELREEVEGLWDIGKDHHAYEVNDIKMNREDAAIILEKAIYDAGAKPPERQTRSATEGESAARGLWGMRSFLKRVEMEMQVIDGKDYGGAAVSLIFNPVSEMYTLAEQAIARYTKRYLKLLEELKPHIDEALIVVPSSVTGGKEFTLGAGKRGAGIVELLGNLQHCGNLSNKEKHLVGLGWARIDGNGKLDSTAFDNWIASLMSNGTLKKEHFDFLQGLWDLNEEMKPEAQKAHRKVYGRFFAEIEAQPFVTPWGTYKGGYVPAAADYEYQGSADIVRDIHALQADEKLAQVYMFSGSPSGFTKGRVEAYRVPLDTDLNNVPRHIRNVQRFTHMAPVTTEVNRLIQTPRVLKAFNAWDPRFVTDVLTPWLNRSANMAVTTPLPGHGPLTKVAVELRNNAAFGAMFASFLNATQQFAGFLLAPATTFVKTKYLVAAQIQQLTHPIEMSRQVRAASKYMSQRMDSEVSAMNDGIRDIIVNPNLWQEGKQFYQRHAYVFQTTVDSIMGPVVWTAAYNQAFEETGNHNLAVKAADSVIRTTQGSNRAVDVSRIEVADAYAKMVLMFYGWWNMLGNVNAKRARQVAHENIGTPVKGAVRIAGVVTMGYFAQMWVSELIAQAWRGGPDDDDNDGWVLDDWIKQVFGVATIKGTLSSIPVVGNLTNAIVNRFVTDNPMDDRASLSPVVSGFDNVGTAAKDLWDVAANDKEPAKLIRSGGEALTFLTGVPFNLVTRRAYYAIEVEKGNINPTSNADYIRGLVTGTASKGSK